MAGGRQDGANVVANDGRDPIDVQVGVNVRRLRKERGITQENLATAIGLTFQQVQKYERGANRISASTLCKIAAVLDVSPALLLPSCEGEGASADALPRVRGVEDLLADFMRIASDEQRRAVRQLIRSMAGNGRAADHHDGAGSEAVEEPPARA